MAEQLGLTKVCVLCVCVWGGGACVCVRVFMCKVAAVAEQLWLTKVCVFVCFQGGGMCVCVC